jgi:hypothetical protein
MTVTWERLAELVAASRCYVTGPNGGEHRVVDCEVLARLIREESAKEREAADDLRIPCEDSDCRRCWYEPPTGTCRSKKP